MPTTLTGLLLFVALLTPGFMFVLILRRSRPERRPSALEEAATVGLASVLCELAVFGGFGVLRTFAPGLTPNVGELVRDPARYLGTHYVSVSLWAVGLLLTAAALAGLAGHLIGKRTAHPSRVSSWWRLFEEWPRDRWIHVACVLDDGSWIEGKVTSFNDAATETLDRDLVLGDPIMHAYPGEEAEPHEASAVCVSAGRIVTMFVTYAEDTDAATSASDSAAGAEASDEEQASSVEDPAPEPSAAHALH